MSRRLIYILVFGIFSAAVIWYASGHVRVPETNFTEASKIPDHKVRVMVPGRILPDRISTQGESVSFVMADQQGTELEVMYVGDQMLLSGTLADAAKHGKTVSVAGHVCEGKFKANDVYLPAY